MSLAKTINFYPDILFLIIVLVIIGVCVALYFIMPILNHKKYEQQRAELKKREEIFLANQKVKEVSAEETILNDEVVAEELDAVTE